GRQGKSRRAPEEGEGGDQGDGLPGHFVLGGLGPLAGEQLPLRRTSGPLVHFCEDKRAACPTKGRAAGPAPSSRACRRESLRRSRHPPGRSPGWASRREPCACKRRQTVPGRRVDSLDLGEPQPENYPISFPPGGGGHPASLHERVHRGGRALAACQEGPRRSHRADQLHTRTARPLTRGPAGGTIEVFAATSWLLTSF